MKKCNKCKRYKGKSEFYKHKRCKDGLAPVCKLCISKYLKDYYIKNKRKIIYRESKKYIINSPDKNKARKYKRAISLRYRYKKSEEEYEAQYYKQKGRCAICRKKSSRNLFLDHDHETGKIRGLLCIKCNFGIAFLNDNIEIMKNAIRYIKHNRKSKGEINA